MNTQTKNNMIEKLTPEQIALFPAYVKKWVSIGTGTARLSYDETSDIVEDFRKLNKMEGGAPLIICKNPIEAWVICELFENNGVTIDNLMAEMASVFDGNPKEYKISQASLPYQTGSFFASVFSFYDYFFRETNLTIDDELYAKYKVWEKTVNIGCIYPLKNLTVVCEKPSEIHLDEQNRLHREGGAALIYDGLGDFKIFSLNGVTVPEYLAVTDAEQLDLEWYKTQDNADVKAEFVRKVGIEQFLNQGTKIDTYEDYPDTPEYKLWRDSQYELWDMGFLFNTLNYYAPYLCMVNQTTKIFHVEGISPECRKLPEALKERFGGRDLRITDIA